MSITPNKIGSMAGAAAASSVNSQVLGNCKIDKKGNICTKPSATFRAVFIGLIGFSIVIDIVMAIALAFDLFSFEEDEIPMMIGLCVFLLVAVIFLFVILRVRFSGEFKLLPEGLFVKTSAVKGIYTYEEVNQWMSKYPPIEYGYYYVFVLDNKIVKYNFSVMTGAMGFLATLCQRANVEIPDTAAMQSKVQRGFAKGRGQEKVLYKELCQRVKAANQ